MNGKARVYIQVDVTERLSNPGVYQNSLQDMVKHRLLGLSFIVSDSEGVGKAKIFISNQFIVVLMQLVQGPYFENHWYNERCMLYCKHVKLKG